MSFVKSMKRAFGFSVDDTDEDTLEEAEETNRTTTVPEPSEPSECSELSEYSEHLEHSEPSELPLAIFDGVIDVFNAAQPDFIKSCLDVEAQRRYLYQAMDSSLKEYLVRPVSYTHLTLPTTSRV